MQPAVPMRRDRSASPRRLVLGLLVCVAGACSGIGGCTASDPLEAVRRQQAVGDLEGSLEPLRELLSERRDDPEILYRYGLALSLTGRSSLAEWSLREAMEDPDYLVPAGLQLALDALRVNNRRETIEITTRILAAEPDNLNALRLRANAHARSSGHYEDALADVDRILELDPEQIEALEPRILALIELDRIDEVGEAIEELGRRIDAIQLGQGVPAWHCVTAAIFADESGEADLAAKRWAGCLERYPANADVVAKAVAFYDSRGEFDRSIETLRNSLAKDPSARPQRVILAERLRQLGENAQAEGLLREATESARPAEAWLDLAKHHQELADFSAAAEAAERAVELSREHGRPSPELMLEYADTLLRAGEFERALRAADEMKLDGHRAMIRARVAQERDEPAEALALFDEAFRLWPDNPWARYYAALAAETIGDFDRAIEEYRYSIRIAPGGTDARVRVGRLHAAEGRAVAALSLLRVQVDQAPLDMEGELLSLRLWARLAQAELVRASLAGVSNQRPERFGEALASAAEGLYERRGASAALGLVRDWQSEGLDLANPLQAAALRALVRFAHLAGKPEDAEAAIRTAIAAHPDAAEFYAVQGLDLELRGAEEAAIRAAYERAVALEADSADALAGLGRIAHSPEQALELFDRAVAVAADSTRVEPKREAVQVLIASGQTLEAEGRLNALLRSHPYDSLAASWLVERRLERGVADDRTLELATRAVRFGGQADALELLSRVHERRNEPESAQKAAAEARRLREEVAADGNSPVAADARDDGDGDAGE